MSIMCPRMGQKRMDVVYNRPPPPDASAAKQIIKLYISCLQLVRGKGKAEPRGFRLLID